MAENLHFVLLGQTMDRQESRLAHVILSQDGVVQTWQDPMVALFGWTADEAIGRTLSTLIIPLDMQDAHTQGLQRWVSNEGELAIVVCKKFRTEGLHKDGHAIPVLIDVQIVRDDHGVRFLGWVIHATEERDG